MFPPLVPLAVAIFGFSGISGSGVVEGASFVEAEIIDGNEGVVMQWARDSNYRFFPLVQHAQLGLMLHPFDLG